MNKVPFDGDIIKVENYFISPYFNMKYLYAKVIKATNNGDYWCKVKNGKMFWFSYRQVLKVM